MKAIEQCRACKRYNLTEFLNLGDQYLSDFRRDDTKPPEAPLIALFCEDCKLVQLSHTVPQDLMYHDRYGFKSGISDSIKSDLNDVVINAYQFIDPKNWLDIASNDGTLLSFVPDHVHRTGVDPVTFLCVEAENHADRIVNEYFSSKPFADYGGQNGEATYEKFDVITSISCFYDMPDPAWFVQEVKNVLAPKGIWIIQQNYLLTTMELAAVDNFCHEHLEYYTLLSLENLLKRFDLEVIEVSTSMVNGGSIRTVVAHKGAYPKDDSVYGQRSIEAEYGVDTLSAYREFADRVGGALEALHNFVKRVTQEGKTVVILAASTRGATIWQSAGLDSRYIKYAVERNPAKVGAMFSAIGVPIVSEEEFRSDKPDYAIIGPWFFAGEIIEREFDYIDKGGCLVVPLPKLEFYD